VKKHTNLLILLFISIYSFSQNKQYVFDNSTPRKTVESHLNFLSPGNFNPKIAAYTLDGHKYSPRQKQALSVKLKDIILKHKININDIPDKRGGLLGRKKYILFPDLPGIYLVRKNKKWLYSEETVDNINKIYNTYYLKRQTSKSGSVKHTKQKNSNNEIPLPDTIKVTFSLATPYNTILSHLAYLSDTLYNPGLAAKTIHFTGADTAKAIELAIKLKQIFLGAEFKVFDLNEISKDTNFVDTISGKHIYYPNQNLKELYLEKIGDKWLYSTVTSKLIASVHKDMYSDEAEEIFSFSDQFIALAGDYNYKGVAGWGIFALLYAIPYSITGLVVANKNAKNAKNMTAELIQLANLKEKGILTEEEFQAKKQSLI
jgi:hypothetical protein